VCSIMIHSFEPEDNFQDPVGHFEWDGPGK